MFSRKLCYYSNLFEKHIHASFIFTMLLWSSRKSSFTIFWLFCLDNVSEISCAIYFFLTVLKSHCFKHMLRPKSAHPSQWLLRFSEFLCGWLKHSFSFLKRWKTSPHRFHDSNHVMTSQFEVHPLRQCLGYYALDNKRGCLPEFEVHFTVPKCNAKQRYSI